MINIYLQHSDSERYIDIDSRGENPFRKVVKLSDLSDSDNKIVTDAVSVFTDENTKITALNSFTGYIDIVGDYTFDSGINVTKEFPELNQSEQDKVNSFVELLNSL